MPWYCIGIGLRARAPITELGDDGTVTRTVFGGPTGRARIVSQPDGDIITVRDRSGGGLLVGLAPRATLQIGPEFALGAGANRSGLGVALDGGDLVVADGARIRRFDLANRRQRGADIVWNDVDPEVRGLHVDTSHYRVLTTEPAIHSIWRSGANANSEDLNSLIGIDTDDGDDYWGLTRVSLRPPLVPQPVSGLAWVDNVRDRIAYVAA